MDFRRAGKLDDAIKKLKDALKLLPTSYSIRTELAYTLLLSGKTEEAVKEGARALGGGQQGFYPQYALYPHYVLGMLYLGTEYPADGTRTKAIEEAEAAVKADAAFAPVYLLKAQALIQLSATPRENRETAHQQLLEAERCVERFLTLAPTANDATFWRGQRAALLAQADYFGETEDGRTVFMSTDLPSIAAIYKKPEPVYSEQARRIHTVGTARLRLVLAADGSVQNILALKTLPNGLTEQAIEAARGIRFNPGVKDGHPVSQFTIIGYNFNIF
jgi:tetratricopeptide (TPR) repeat protein